MENTGKLELWNLECEDIKDIETPNYGQLNRVKMYYAYKLSHLINNTVKSKIKHENLPFKVTIEVDKEKLRMLPEKEQKFYVDCKDIKLFLGGNREEEQDVYDKALTDLIYLSF